MSGCRPFCVRGLCATFMVGGAFLESSGAVWKEGSSPAACFSTK